MSEAYQAMLSPIVLSIVVIVLMMQIAFWRHATASWVISCVGIVLAAASLISSHALFNSEIDQIVVTPLLVSDHYSVFFSALILFATLVTTLLARDYLEHRDGENEEFYLLLLLSALGGLILVSSTHLASFLLGLELLGVALYALIAYPERGHLPLEAAVKYLVLSGAASAILLFGFALVYAATGALSFAGIGNQLAAPMVEGNQLLVLIGCAMTLTGIGFKLSLVPFHMWTPDVYHGAPSPVTGFLATVSKGAIFAALLRLFIDAQLYQYQSLILGLSLIAIASMLVGNLLALKQNNLKRLLAYSSIAHLGYLLIVLVVYSVSQQSELAIEATAFYLVAYVVTSLAAFALLSIISNFRESDTVDDVTGLFWQQPLLALLLTVALLSLAGIPLTVGFIGKFYIFTAGIKASLWLLVAVLVIGSAIGIYYYLRIIFAMAAKPLNQQDGVSKLSLVAKCVVCLLIFMMFYFGVLPQTLMEHLGGLAV